MDSIYDHTMRPSCGRVREAAEKKRRLVISSLLRRSRMEDEDGKPVFYYELTDIIMLFLFRGADLNVSY